MLTGYYSKLEQRWIKCLCVHSIPIISLSDHKKMALSISVGFQKHLLIVACCTFDKFKIRTLIPSKFKKQSNDTFKLLSIINKSFLTKIFTLYRWGFDLKLPIHCYFGPDDYVSAVALLWSFYFTLKLVVKFFTIIP